MARWSLYPLLNLRVFKPSDAHGRIFVGLVPPLPWEYSVAFDRESIDSQALKNSLTIQREDYEVVREGITELWLIKIARTCFKIFLTGLTD